MSNKEKGLGKELTAPHFGQVFAPAVSALHLGQVVVEWVSNMMTINESEIDCWY